MRPKLLFLLTVWLIWTTLALSQNAPVSTIGVDVSNDEEIVVPVMVTGFTNVGSCNVQILYDPLIASCTSVTMGPDVAGSIATNLNVTGQITIGWYTWPGITLPDNSILFNLHFSREDYGYSELTWDFSYPDRQWSGGDFVQLIDTPEQSFYVNGSLEFVPVDAVNLGIKVYLEGAYGNEEMTTSLNDQSLIPLSQPYSSAPWEYPGNENVLSVPAGAVDWILIELRETTGDASTATADKRIARDVGFLMKNGLVKGMDGMTNLSFPVSVNDNIYVVIYHRNHISVISSSPLTIFNGSGYYDFTNGELKAYGGETAHKVIAPGVWGLAAGDSNSDGTVDLADKQNYWDINSGNFGYLLSDFSMNGQVSNQDKNDLWYFNLNFDSQVP